MKITILMGSPNKNKAMLEFILLIVTMFTLSACGNSEDAA